MELLERTIGYGLSDPLQEIRVEKKIVERVEIVARQLMRHK